MLESFLQYIYSEKRYSDHTILAYRNDLNSFFEFADINPEEALERTNKKFIARFQYLEKMSQKDGKDLSTMSLAEMDEYWNAAKKL